MIINRHLSEQVRTTLEGIASSKNTIANLEEKISRLEEASLTLDSSISEIETFKSTTLDLVIDPKKWKGEEYNDFEEAYHSHEENVKLYVSRTEEAKEAIDDDIKRYKEKLDTALTGLSSLEGTLEDLNKQVNQ